MTFKEASKVALTQLQEKLLTQVEYSEEYIETFRTITSTLEMFYAESEFIELLDTFGNRGENVTRDIIDIVEHYKNRIP